MSIGMLAQKKTTVTVRIDDDVLDQLHTVSEGTGQSLNSTINHLLDQEANWHLHAAAAGFMYFPRMLISNLSCKLSEQEIIESAHKYFSEELEDAILLIRKEVNFKEAREMLGLWMETSGISYRFEQIADNYILILGLRLGKKSSLLMAEMLALLLKKLGARNVGYEITTNAVILRYEERESYGSREPWQAKG